MSNNNIITLYDLVLANGMTLSPFVWRVKMAILHKGFELNAVPTSYNDIKNILDGTHTRLPVIEDKGTVVEDSMDIIDYLDANYSDHPLLFNSKGERNYARFLDAWMFQNVVRHWFTCYCLDQVKQSCPEDKDYIRESRERLFLQERKMEDVVVDREKRLVDVRPNLEPLRVHLQDSKWFAGDEPNHIDYLMLSHFFWCASIATCPPLEKNDPLLEWINRGFDLFDGLGRDERLHSLF